MLELKKGINIYVFSQYFIVLLCVTKNICLLLIFVSVTQFYNKYNFLLKTYTCIYYCLLLLYILILYNII